MEERKIFKKSENKKVFGVCGGIADYFNIDPTIVRLGAIVLALCSGVGILAYLIGAIVMPK